MSRRVKAKRLLVQKREMERRLRRRYAIERTLEYRVLREHQCTSSGSGKTLNLSSSGVLFTTEGRLEPGQSVELLVNWPAALGDRCATKLVIFGTVVRAPDNGAALAIQRYEFRASLN
jgi:hypothetical protein